MSEITAGKWQPLGAAAELDTMKRTALTALEKIADSCDPGEHGPSLMHGTAGVSLALAYASKVAPESGYDERAVKLLAATLERLPGQDVSVGLESVLVGIAWTLEHLRGWLVEPEDAAPEIEHLRRTLDTSDVRTFPTALLDGAVGIGVLALERDDNDGRRLLEAVVRFLAGSAVLCRDGVSWLTGNGRHWWDRRFLLGMANGVAGAIALLVRAARKKVEGSQPLLDDAVRWVLAQERTVDGRRRYPSVIFRELKGENVNDSRLAWCDGTLGLALSLLQAAPLMDLARPRQIALDLARSAADLDVSSGGIRVPGFCHGAAGVAQMYARLYHATGDPGFRSVARRWLSATLTMFQRRRTSGAPLQPGLLSGDAGVALVLLAGSTAVSPDWDRLFFLSPMPRLRDRDARSAHG